MAMAIIPWSSCQHKNSLFLIAIMRTRKLFVQEKIIISGQREDSVFEFVLSQSLTHCDTSRQIICWTKRIPRCHQVIRTWSDVKKNLLSNKYWKYSKCVDCGRRCPDTKCQIKTNPSIKLQILKTKQHQMRQICLYCHSFLTKVTNRVQVSKADLITIILTLNHIIQNLASLLATISFGTKSWFTC